jgi:GNAT superfamily N-acetyltransferase
MSLRPETLAVLDDYWADWLGCEPSAFAEGGVTVRPARWPGRRIRCLFRGDATVVVAPERHVEAVRARADALHPLDGRDADRVRAALGLGPVVLGPQFVGYLDGSTLVEGEREGSDDDGTVRPLERHDARALSRLRVACPHEEWAERVGGFAVDGHEVVHGRFVDGRLVAVAAAGVDDAVGGIGVVTHPDHRGRGHGRAVVASVSRALLDDGLVPEYRASEAWTASLSLARGVGFERYGTYVAVGTGASASEGAVGGDPESESATATEYTTI